MMVFYVLYFPHNVIASAIVCMLSKVEKECLHRDVRKYTETY